ncbi:MAG TPA: ABC transporter permease [Acetivibrio sp.]|nr:ABC transporter permease [Acetivibrio sp.]HPT91083.1 ABC transporter permease [Acetivibrio sp.]
MKILCIAWYDLIRLLRDKTTLLIIIVIPIILTVVMGFAYGSGKSDGTYEIPVGIATDDNSTFVRELIEKIKENNSIKTLEMNRQEIIEGIKESELEAGFIIPGDFTDSIREGKAGIYVLKQPASAGYAVAEGVIRTALTELKIKEDSKIYFDNLLETSKLENRDFIISRIEERFEKKLEGPSTVIVEDIRVSGGEESLDFDGMAQSSIGIAVMFVMFSVMIGVGVILEDKKNRTWERLSATPVTKTVIILGKVLGIFFKGWIQVGILILFGRFVLGVNWGNSFLASILLISVYLMCITTMGILLSSVVKSNAQLAAYSSVFILSTSMLAGCYWPLEIVPEFMQKAAMIFPQYWAVKALTNIVGANMGIGSILPHIAVLAIMTGIFLIASVAVERYRVKSCH